MSVRRRFFLLAFLTLSISSVFAPRFTAQEPSPEPPAPSAARILLLPRRLVAGDRATLAVLDVNGRLTPGATVTFSNGDRLKTDATGRALFVAPMKPGALSGSIEGRPGRVATTILAPEDAAATAIEISSAPRVASLTDRFEMLGKGFCGDADGNHITLAGQEALVLASSPVSVLVLPPAELSPGQAAVTVSCLKRKAPDFFINFVALDLQADASPLKRGEHRTLTVRVHGTEEKVSLEARNLAPDITELVGGNPVRRLSIGGPENVAAFEVVGQKNGSFLISIRLVPSLAHPR
jgi:hypothetical protein